MLPPFGKIVSEREKSNLEILRAMAHEIEPIVSDIANHYIHEGTATAIVRSSGETDQTVIKKHEGSVEIRTVPLAEYTYEDVLEKIREMASQFAASTAKQIIETISESAEKSGNIVDGKGRKFSEELLLETLSTMSHSFDADGQWHAPSMVVTSSQMEQIAEIKRRQSPQERAYYDRCVEEIIRAKKAAYDSEQARRILAG